MHQFLSTAIRHHQSGDLDSADALYAQVLQVEPYNADALHLRGVVAHQRGLHDLAIQYTEDAIALNPWNAAYHSNLGLYYQAAARLDDAVKCYRRAIEIHPTLASAHSNMALALLRKGKVAEAEVHCRQALALKPDFAQAHAHLGRILLERNRPDEAIAACNEALRYEPRLVDAYRTLGQTYRESGRFDEARAAYETVLRLHPGETTALYSLSLIKRHGKEDVGDVARMQKMLAVPGLPATQRAELHYGLGKAFDDLGRYDEAFPNFAEANRLVGPAFDPATCEAAFQRIVQTFTAERFRTASPAGSDSDRPVFILGMPRSGTTVVEQILSSHPLVHGCGELTDLQDMMGQLDRRPQEGSRWPECVFTLPPAEIDALAEGYLAKNLPTDEPVARLTDKMPGNFMLLGLIARLFPRARVIHCRRNPLDTCLSCYFVNFSSRLQYAYDLSSLGFFYRLYERLMDHWRRVLPLPILDVEYEDLVMGTEAVSRRMVEFCGLEWDPRCLRFHENPRLVKTSSNWQVRQPIYSSSIGRWKHYRRHLEPLIGALGIDLAQLEAAQAGGVGELVSSATATAW